MYHRFNEPKYPSTNIQMDIFKEQMKIIENLKTTFINPKNLDSEFTKIHTNKSILLTIDDGYSSFYKNAWPYLKHKKIPFILFISTREIGKYGYMNWDQVREIQNSNIGVIGNHSHSHDYLVDLNEEEINQDINQSINIFKKELGYNPNYFSYPFGEYSLNFIEIIKKNFKFSFGQHSGVIDNNKDRYELPRFPINEKYGDLERFEFLINLYPLQFKNLYPDEKYLTANSNPPKFSVEFFDEQKNIKNINCFSDEGNKWGKSNINFIQNTLNLNFKDKFNFRRGRINCSLLDDGIWRWLGVQFSVK